MEDEKFLKDSVVPVNIKQTKKILNQMINCICKIKIGAYNGTGIFCKIKLDENTIINCLMTNYHVLNKEYIKKIKK